MKNERLAYLSHIHKESWQIHLDSISGRSTSPVYVCIITASNESSNIPLATRATNQEQIASDFNQALVIPDPGGKRVGSGGAPLCSFKSYSF